MDDLESLRACFYLDLGTSCITQVGDMDDLVGLLLPCSTSCITGVGGIDDMEGLLLP